MKFFNRLTGLGKALVVAGIVAAAGCGIYFSGLTKSISSRGSGDYDAVIAVNTYSGFSPIVWANGGLEGTTESPIYKKYGLKLKFVVLDDFTTCRSSMTNGDVQIGYCTLDALPVEMGSGSAMSDFRYFMLLNFSHGADALVADKTVNSAADLKGKKVAFAEGTASETLLLNFLETSGLSMNDIEPVKCESGLKSAESFKALAVNCAAVWSPDDEDCVSSIKNSKILTSSADASMLISDGFIAKKEWLEKNPELATKIVEAFLWANSEYTNKEDVYNEAVQIFAKAFETDTEFAKLTGRKVRPATLTDNLQWFGLNSDYSGMTGERIYSKMSRAYSQLGLVSNALPWTKVSYSDIIESIAAKNSLDNEQSAFGTASREFSAPTVQHEEVKAISSKKVTINFPTAGYTLDNEARSIIDREFVDIVQGFADTRIRVVGNTDNTGNYDSNVTLTKKRAQAVVDYLVSEYNINKNRFVTVGNGPKRAIEANVTGASADYRTTDLELISE